jgi:hypothetical protein
MKNNKEEILIDEVKLQSLIMNGLDRHNLKDRCTILRTWIKDEKGDSPWNFLGENMFFNYLYYILLNSIDVYIDNTKLFKPTQLYGQEYSRIFSADLTTQDLCGPHSETDSRDVNFICFYSLAKIDMEIGKGSSYDYERSYSTEFQREFRHRNNHYFSESYIQSLMDPAIYNNYLIYKILYQRDERIGNCYPFCPSQDYLQEYVRQLKVESIKEGLEKDEVFVELNYMIDCNMNTLTYGEEFDGPISIDETLQSRLKFNAEERK